MLLIILIIAILSFIMPGVLVLVATCIEIKNKRKNIICKKIILPEPEDFKTEKYDIIKDFQRYGIDPYVIRMFITFLMENDVYHSYLRNMIHFKKFHSGFFNVCFMDPETSMFNFIQWVFPREGTSYWLDINSKWRAKYKKYRIKKAIVSKYGTVTIRTKYGTLKRSAENSIR